VEPLEARELLATHVFLVNGAGDNGYEDGFAQLAMDLRRGPLAAAGLDVNVCDWDRLHTHNTYSDGDGPLHSDGQFVSDLTRLINGYPSWDHVVLIGHSYGGDSVLKVANQTSHRIDLLAALDPVGGGGFRSKEAEIATIIGGPLGGILAGKVFSADNLPSVPRNVQFFYNRWQEAGFFPIDFTTSGHLDSRAYASVQ
jgi:pimeloyl-ACP methyl ester carboxylesterase